MDNLTDKQIETLAKSCPWSYEETRDFVRNCEAEGISLVHITMNLDGCAKQGLPLPSARVLAKALKGDR